ncbi:vitamin B12 transporter [Sinobacterium caligoides]|uniref:Vitamin B12 transporter n=1 Tax=Sinobacterium caligoides TaxID=933926 RepID=A0A3N2DNA1_9GAMM|nr:TonB-dependent receptor [Sinobacterium caligoides]ROS01283.1 vitamin B12 transporter [Sinobacterium caligoides]
MKHTLLALPLAIVSANALLANTTLASEAPEEIMEEMVVVGNRIATPISKVLAPVTVIDKDDINRRQPPSLGALLATTPGVNMVQSGSTGAQTALMIRGSKTAQSVVLLDGLRIGSATTGSTAYQYIDPESIDRVEIVRGARSSLYGADAVGGVIQLFTNDGTASEDYSKAIIKQSYGSHNTLSSVLGIKGQQDDTFYQLSASHHEGEGFDSTAEKGNGNDDKDAFRNTSITASLGKHFGENFTLKGSFYQSKGKSEYDINKPTDSKYNPLPTSTHINPYTDYLVQAASIKASLQATENWRTELVFGGSKDGNVSKDSFSEENNNVLALASKFNTQRYFASWLNEITITNQQRIIAGIDTQYDKIDTSDNYDKDNRYNNAVYAQYEVDFSRSQLSLSARSDDNSTYGRNNTGHAEFGFDLTDNINIVTSVGTAFRAPSFNDLYYPNDGGSKGNPDITPETSTNKEFSIRGDYDVVDWQVNLFHNNVDDLIEWGYNPETFYSQPENISKATLKGYELIATTEFYQWKLNANYTRLMAENDNTGKTLQNRPEHSADIDLSRTLNDWTFTIEQQIRSSSYSDRANNNELSGYGLTHLRLSYAINPEWQVTAALNNIFDKEYYTNADFYNINYNNDGFNTLLSVAYTPSW